MLHPSVKYKKNKNKVDSKRVAELEQQLQQALADKSALENEVANLKTQLLAMQTQSTEVAEDDVAEEEQPQPPIEEVQYTSLLSVLHTQLTEWKARKITAPQALRRIETYLQDHK